MFSPSELQVLYSELNAEFFEGELGPCQIRWSRKLTSAAGNIVVQKRLMTLSTPLLIEAFTEGKSYEVCGVRCDSSQSALREIVKHEMIHLFLWEKGLPHGHTAQFRLKARQIGQPKTRHGIARPTPLTGWVYSCGHCGATLHRRKRYGRRVACALCCRRYAGGKFDARFQLHGKRLVALPSQLTNTRKTS